MNVRQAIALLLLLAVVGCKYEDTFGHVYDWKREGQSSLKDAVVGVDSTLLVLEDGISVKDANGNSSSSGKTRHSVDFPHADYAIDRKTQKLFLLAKNRLQLQEFHATTGKFVQTVETDQGYAWPQ
jgi:hypothetical protein